MTTETQTTTSTTTTLPPYSPDLLPEAYRQSETFKNFKSWDDVFKSHEEARRLIGANKATVFRIPDGEDVPAEVWKKLGKPDKYEIPAGMLDTFTPDAKSALLDSANRGNLTANQFNELLTSLDKQGKADFGAAQSKLQTDRQAAEAQARLALGDAYDQNVNLAKDVLVAFEHPELWDTIDQSGLTRNPGFLNLMAEMGKLLGDDKIIEGQAASFSLTPDQAGNEIIAKRSDANFMKRYTDANAPGHKEAVAELQRLYQAKYGGKA